MNRITQALVALAALMVLVVGAIVLVSAFGNPFHRVTDRAVPATVTPGQPADRTPSVRLGGFTDLGNGLMRAPLLAEWNGVESYYSKEIANAAVNLLYAGPGGDRWLYPLNGQLLTLVEDIGPGRADAPPVATLIQVVDADRNGNGTLSMADGARLVLMRPDGTGPQVLAEGLTEDVRLSRGASRWLAGWQGGDGRTMLAEIDPATGAATPPRALTLPGFP